MMRAAGQFALALVAGSLAGCGGRTIVPGHAFSPAGGVTAGLSSGLWGDGGSGPSGMHIGCLAGRRFSVYVTAHNRTKRTVTVTDGGGDQPFAKIMARVAVQIRLAPLPPKGDLAVTGMGAWSRQRATPTEIPPGRDVGIQSNYVMRNCNLLHPHELITLNRSVAITYRQGGTTAREPIADRGARIILTRPPQHAPDLTAEARR
jgi:hypothetical protein